MEDHRRNVGVTGRNRGQFLQTTIGLEQAGTGLSIVRTDPFNTENETKTKGWAAVRCSAIVRRLQRRWDVGGAAYLLAIFILLRLRVARWQVRIYGLIIRYTIFEIWDLVYKRVNRVGNFYAYCAHNGLLDGKSPGGAQRNSRKIYEPET